MKIVNDKNKIVVEGYLEKVSFKELSFRGKHIYNLLNWKVYLIMSHKEKEIKKTTLADIIDKYLTNNIDNKQP